MNTTERPQEFDESLSLCGRCSSRSIQPKCKPVREQLRAVGLEDHHVVYYRTSAMNEGAVFLAIVVIAVLSYRFFAGPTDGISGSGGGSASQPSRQAPTRGGRQVTPAMVEVIQTMFPHLPPSSIAYDLSRTGSVEITTNNILARNSLPPAPAGSPYHQLFPSPQPPSNSSSSSGIPTSSKPDLITRYKLDSRLSEEIPPEQPASLPTDKGKGKAPSNWSQSQAEREQNFKKKRDDMILRARRQMQEQAAAKSEQSPS